MRFRKTAVERVTVVKFKVDNRGSDGTGWEGVLCGGMRNFENVYCNLLKLFLQKQLAEIDGGENEPFLARDSISLCLARYMYMLSPVRLSVSRVDQSKTVAVRIIKFSPYGSSTRIVFAE